MPGAIKYVPPTDQERSDFNAQVTSERQIRRKNYQEAVEYYEGKQPDQLPIEEIDGKEVDDNVVVNMVKMTADRTVSFLFPSEPRLVIDPTSVKDTPEEDYLNRFFKENGGLQFLCDWGLQSFLAGTTYLRVTKPKRKLLEKATNKNRVYPKLSLLNPTSVTAFWRADDIGDIVWYEQRFYAGAIPYIRDYVQEEDGTWTIHTYKDTTAKNERPILGLPDNYRTFTSKSDNFRGYTHSLDVIDFTGNNWEVAEKKFVHEGTVPPIIETRHLPHPNDYYGLSEFNQKDLQDAINFVMSHRNQIVRVLAEPTDVITGASVDEVEEGGKVYAINNPNAKMNRLEVKGDLAGISDTLQKMVEIYLSVARVVVLKGEAADLQRVTNASIRTLFIDALSKNAVLQSAFGRSLSMVSKAALEVAYADGMIETVPDDLYPYVRWEKPLPQDELEISSINQVMVTLGAMSKQTAAKNLGLDWDFESQTIESERQEDMVHQEEQMTLEQKFQPDPLTKPNSGVQ